MTNEQRENCKKILDFYGEENQKFIFIEELGELLQAVVKVWRYGDTRKNAYINELADVSIMIEQLKQALPDDERRYYETCVESKITRQIDRMLQEC